MKLMMDRPSEQVGQLAVCYLCFAWQPVLPGLVWQLYMSRAS